MKSNRIWVWTTIAILGILGCAQKPPNEKLATVSPVSMEEARLIRLRMTSGLAIHPREDIGLGTPTEKTARGVTSESLKSLFPFESSAQIQPPLKAMTDSEKLLEFLLHVRKATLKYLETYPADVAHFRKISSTISEETCLTDGEMTYCGPEVLTGAMFSLGDPATELVLHEEWLPAIENTQFLASSPGTPGSALENFVRNFVFGSFKYLVMSNSIFTEANCRAAHERLNSVALISDEAHEVPYELRKSPEKWPINPCNLILFSEHGIKSPI